MGIGIVAIILVGFFDKISMRRFLITASICIGGVFALLMTIDTIVGRFVQYGNEASEQTRQVMNLAAKAMLDDNPIGVGWNNFAVAVNYPFPYGDVIDNWNLDRGMNVSIEYAKGVVESHYWLIKSENGLRRGRYEAAILSGIIIAFALTYLHSNLERVLTQTKNLALWMLFLGLIGALIRLPKSAFDPDKDSIDSDQ